MEHSPSPWMSGQLTVMSVIVGIVPLLCLGVLVHAYYDVPYREKTRSLLGEQVLRTAQGIDTFIDEKIANLRQQAAGATLEGLSAPGRLHAHLLDLQGAYPDVFTGLEVLDAGGRIVARAGAGHNNPPDASWFAQAINSPRFVSGLGPLPVNVSFGIRLKTGQELWLLRAFLDPRLATEKTRAFHPGGRGGAFVLDKDGPFGFDPDQQPASDATLRVLAGQVFPEGRPVIVEADDRAGERQWYACAPLRSTGGVLVFHQPKAELLQNLDNARLLSAAIVVLGCAGIAATTLVMARRTAARLRQANILQQQMQRQIVEAGKLVAIGEQAAGIAHEINNPLAIMMENAGWIGDILGTDDPGSEENRAEVQAALQTIVTQGHRCREIAHKLLGFARKADSTAQVVRINPMLEDIAGFARQKARYRGVEVSLDLTPEAGEVNGSPTELQQVVLNLVNNAIDAVDTDGGHVRLRSRRTKDAVNIEVEDNGHGIPADILPRIFEPFFTSKPAGLGTGLGLAICRDILTGMGGSISVDSTLGRGSTFSVRLPLRPES